MPPLSLPECTFCFYLTQELAAVQMGPFESTVWLWFMDLDDVMGLFLEWANGDFLGEQFHLEDGVKFVP